jgi:hypothetical protein
MAHVEQSRALYGKAKPIVFLFKATKMSKKLRKLVNAKKRELLD